MPQTRQSYINAVKVKLEEISPFEEPYQFIAEDDNHVNTIKPIFSYIDQSLDEAVSNCLRTLPISLLHDDIVCKTGTMTINDKGVGIISLEDTETTRYVRFRQDLLKRDITAFITTEDPLYLVQQDEDVRGGICKPVAVISSDTLTAVNNDWELGGLMEIYSFPKEYWNTNDQTYKLLAIETKKKAGIPGNNGEGYPYYIPTGIYVRSTIDDFIILECAAMVSEILGDVQSAQIFRNQFQAKLQATLQ